MRSFLSTPFLGLALVAALTVIPANAASLRSSKDKEHNPWEVQVDLRQLQTGNGYDNETFENDGSDASLLNRLIQLLLPVVNGAFQALVPDPMNIPLAGRFQLGEINLLICKASADLSYDFGQIAGLASMAIDSLQVVLGTEKVEFGCLETLWNAAFDMTIASTTNFTVDDVGAGIYANGCGLNFNRNFSGGVNTFRPIMRGAVNISGALMGTMATIDFADIAKALQVGYESIEVYVDDAPKELNTFIGNATSELSVLMKDELVRTVAPAVKPIVEETMKQSRQLSYSQYLSINSGFGRNEIKRQATKFYQSTATFLGFGGGVAETAPGIGHYGERK